MLSETFQGRSAQLLAVIEALTDSKRRIAQTSLGAPDSDDSILDVFAELFFAGSELIAGVRGTRSLSPGKHDSVISENIEDSQLIDMAMNGRYCVPYQFTFLHSHAFCGVSYHVSFSYGNGFHEMVSRSLPHQWCFHCDI